MQTSSALQMDLFGALPEDPDVAAPGPPALTLVPAPAPAAPSAPAPPDYKLTFTIKGKESLYGSPLRDLMTEITDSLTVKIQEMRDAGIYGTKFRIVFDRPVSLQVNSRKQISAEEAVVRLFMHGSGLCYTFRKKTGYAFAPEHYTFLKSIEPILPDAKAESETLKIKALANRIHPNAWSDLREKLLADPGNYYKNYGYTVTSITRKFPSYVIDSIKDAFENKANYSYQTWPDGNKGRKLSVELKVCDDGIFRAWFSSEFPGCANGDYWLVRQEAA